MNDLPHDNHQDRRTSDEASDALSLATMTEGELMAYVLHQLCISQWVLTIRFTDADLEAFEEERIGEHFSRYPFLY